MANKYVLDIILNAQDKASGAIDAVGGKLGGLAGLAGGGLVVAGAALTAVGAAAFNTATDIDLATDQMTAALDLSAAGAANFEQAMLSVYKNNFGDGFDDISQALIAVEHQFAQLGGTQGVGELESVTEAALALRDVFGEDVNETTSAAVSLMKNFGLTSDEAMNLITRGFQRGLNSSNDFIDTINEYSTQFASGGASAEQFFSLLETGIAGGMLGTDRAADAFKEFRVRIQDGSKLTAESLDAIGLSSEEMLDQLATGQITAADAFSIVTGALSEVENSSLRMQAGVGLLGTQYEDLGDAALGLDLNNAAFADAENAVDSLNVKYDNLGSMVEGYKRRALLALAPTGEALLSLGNDAMPHVEKAFTWLEENVPAMIETAMTVGGEWLDWFMEKTAGTQAQVGEILAMAQAFWDEHGDAIMRIVGNVGTIAEALFDQLVGNILDIVQLGLQVLTGDWEGASETLEGIWTRTKETIGTITTGLLDSVLAILGEFIPDFKMSGQSLIDGLLGGLKDKWESVKSWFGGLSWPSLPAIDWNPFDGQPAGNAAGTPYWRGGLSMVGESGPELISLPRGARVSSADETRRMLANQQPGNVWNIAINLSGSATEADGQRAARGFLSEMRAMGVR